MSGYNKPHYHGQLVVLSQWNGLISEFDYKNKLFTVNTQGCLNSHDNTMAMFDVIFDSSLPDIPEIKVKINLKYFPKKSATLLKQLIIRRFDADKFINKTELIEKIDAVIEEDKKITRLQGQKARFLKSEKPKKHLAAYLLTPNYYDNRDLANLSIEQFKMIDSFIFGEGYYSTYNLVEVLRYNVSDKIEKINHLFANINNEKIKDLLLQETYIREAIATYKLKDII